MPFWRGAFLWATRRPVRFDNGPPGDIGAVRYLSRDSLNDQRIDSSLPVQGSHGCVDCAVEDVGISEGLMGQMARLEIVPDNLDVVEFGSYFGSHSTVSQCLRASMALRVSLLTWTGPCPRPVRPVLLPVLVEDRKGGRVARGER